jgi:hypothetical protein
MDWLLVVLDRQSGLIQYFLVVHFWQIADFKVVLIVANFLFKNLLVDLPNFILH